MKEGKKHIICCRISAFGMSVVHELCVCFQSDKDKSTCLLGEPNTHFTFIPMRLQPRWLSVPPSRLCNFCSLLYCAADIARVVWEKRERESCKKAEKEKCTEFLFLYFLLCCAWVTCGPCLGRRGVHIAQASFSLWV